MSVCGLHTDIFHQKATNKRDYGYKDNYDCGSNGADSSHCLR